MPHWTIEDAARLYKIQEWGSGFFSINRKGNVQIDPHQDGRKIDLKELVDDILDSSKLDLPVLIRFSNILQRRIEEIHSAFVSACRNHAYKGEYYGVYPIKVNQQRQVVEEIVRFGRPFNLGLEAGSKPELHAVLAMMDNPKGLIVCNGYKDESYIRMALLGRKLDRRILIVVEKPSELRTIFRVSSDLGVRPEIGLRIKLSTAGSGRWECSGGENSKFGLTASEIMKAVSIAKSEGLLDCIKLLHFHLGSQITDIASIQEGLKEVSRFYEELIRYGCDVRYIDVGGGLGVDYDGSRSSSSSSTNYTIQDYAECIVSSLATLCRQRNLPHPDIVSESGRALTAHHSVMVLDVLEVAAPPAWEGAVQVTAQHHEGLQGLNKMLGTMRNGDALESLKAAERYKQGVFEAFKQGKACLEERATCERLYWTIAKKAYRRLRENGAHISSELMSLKDQLSDKYFCNFSVFQSLPDSRAVDQVFPVMPIHRLLERPAKEATLQDITCDSDGKVDRFIGSREGSPVLAVHDFDPDQPYLLGVFLVGAYQEILGDLHNLFGDTNAVHVSLDAEGEWHFEQMIEGEDISDVLEYVQFNAADLLERVARMLGISLGRGDIQPDEAEEMMSLYREGLQGYTYLLGDRDHH